MKRNLFSIESLRSVQLCRINHVSNANQIMQAVLNC